MNRSAACAAENCTWNPPQSSQASPVTVAPISTNTDWTTEARSRLEALRKLRRNWDGYNSPELTELALSSAYQLLSTLQRRELSIPRIAPVTGGGIAFELIKHPRILEFEVLPNGAVEFLCVEKRDAASDVVDEGHLSIPRLYEAVYLVDWLLGD